MVAKKAGTACNSGPRSCSRLTYSLDVSDPLEVSDPIVGFGFDLSAADEPSGAELCSLAPLDLSDDWAAFEASSSAVAAPEDGDAELRSAAPPDVSAVPSAGSVACFATSGVTPGCVGSWPASGVLPDGGKSSAAMAGAMPRSTATAVVTRKRFIRTSFLSIDPIGTSDEITNLALYRSAARRSSRGQTNFL